MRTAFSTTNLGNPFVNYDPAAYYGTIITLSVSLTSPSISIPFAAFTTEI